MTCSVPVGFNWATFVDRLTSANIAATLTDSNNDNVEQITILRGPIANWKVRAYDAGNVAGSLTNGGGVGVWTILQALKLTYDGPDYDSSAHESLASAAPYANALAYITANGDTLPTAFVSVGDVHTMTSPGVAITGSHAGSWCNFKGESTTDVMALEQYFQLNASASDQTKGYPGVCWVYLNGGDFFTSDSFSLMDEVRCGLFDVDADVEDVAFDGSTMRAGLWVKKNGSDYDLKKFVNGTLVESLSRPVGSGMDNAYFDVRLYWPSTTTTGPNALSNSVRFGVRTSSSGSYTANDDYNEISVDMSCVKYAQYFKPNAGNSVPFQTDLYLSMMTDPSYMFDVDPFWTNYIKTTETNA